MPPSPGSSLIARAERRFGHLAIPDLVRWAGIFQGIVWLLRGFSPEVVSLLAFDRDAILGGQVWRLVTFAMIPGTQNPLLILFVVFFLWFISAGLEREWGSFRVNLYALATVACLILFGFIPGAGGLLAGAATYLFFASVFLAFASIYPEQVIHLFGIIPIKAKWLGFAKAGLLFYQVLLLPPFLLAVAAALFPYATVFLPALVRGMKQRGQAAARRAKFQAKAAEEESEAFHTCAGCPKTDLTHPELEFRVAADGEEYCLECLPRPEASRADA